MYNSQTYIFINFQKVDLSIMPVLKSSNRILPTALTLLTSCSSLSPPFPPRIIIYPHHYQCVSLLFFCVLHECNHIPLLYLLEILFEKIIQWCDGSFNKWMISGYHLASLITESGSLLASGSFLHNTEFNYVVAISFSWLQCPKFYYI